MNKESAIGVSVICITYNQEEYIGAAIESVLSQKINFPYEIVIHDDVSSDKTQEIIQSYIYKYPSVVHGVFEKKNQYSQGIDFFSSLVTDVAKGKYIALCEGDDFWIDNTKLQRQWEALETHPECDMCACRGVTVTEDGKREISEIRPAKDDCILSADQVIKGGGQYLVTAGLFFRRNMFAKKMNFEEVISLDYAHQIKGALRGGIYYIDRKMAVYRRYTKSSWTNQVLKNEDRLKVQWEQEIALLKQLDIDTEGKYHEVIQERLKVYTPFEQQLEAYDEDIKMLFESCEYPVYIWGMGRRGSGLEKFCRQKGYKISGICDAINSDIGKETDCGNMIYSTEKVISKAKTILASNRFAYDDLIKSDYDGKLIDFQQYMPLG